MYVARNISMGRCVGGRAAGASLVVRDLIVSLLLAATWTFPGGRVAGAEIPLAIHFSGAPGPYTLEQWKRDWPGCRFEDGVTEGRISLHEQGAVRWLRVTCQAGKISPGPGGAGWRQPFGRQESAELTYSVRFEPDFDFVKGGKLPGLSGGPENVGGGKKPTGENGFSVRVMWRRDGRGELYVYHVDQKGNNGDSFPFPEDFRFPPGEAVQVRLMMSLNTPGQRDGVARVWTTLPGGPERLMVERSGLCWRTVDTFGVDSLLFQTFHGGSTPDWAPRRNCWVEFSDFRVGSPR